MKTCIVIGASPETTFPADFSALDCYVICADGGYDRAAAAGIHPDVVVGDFDSSSAVMTGDFAVYPLPREKDDTDLLAAVKMGMERGFRRFRIFGALGGRIDHTYGNFSVLQWIADNGGQGILESRTTTVYLCRGGQEPLLLNGMEGRTVSVFPFGTDHCVVTYHGLQYPMNHGILSSGMPLGVSNVVLSPEASILVESGTALVFLTEEI